MILYTEHWIKRTNQKGARFSLCFFTSRLEEQARGAWRVLLSAACHEGEPLTEFPPYTQGETHVVPEQQHLLSTYCVGYHGRQWKYKADSHEFLES